MCTAGGSAPRSPRRGTRGGCAPNQHSPGRGPRPGDPRGACARRSRASSIRCRARHQYRGAAHPRKSHQPHEERPMSEREQYLKTLEQEAATTLKVLRAFPAAKSDLKPHAKARSAKDLAWTFVFEGYGGTQGADGELPFPPKGMPAKVPEHWDAVVAECEKAFKS